MLLWQVFTGKDSVDVLRMQVLTLAGLRGSWSQNMRSWSHRVPGLHCFSRKVDGKNAGQPLLAVAVILAHNDAVRQLRLFMIGLAVAISLAWSIADGAEGPPNVLLVVADSLGWQDLPRHGGEGAAPTLEKLADEGMEVLRFYSCPAGATSRASLLTGRYHYRTGVAGNSHGENVMHSYEITLAEVFRDNGYATGHFGSWKNGRNWPSNAQGQGFQVVSQNEGWQALEFIGEERDQPFFCWLSLPGMADEVAAIDDALKRVLQALTDTGKNADTLVVFTSDTAAGSRPPEGDEKPAIPRFFGDADSVHEGGVRVPFLVRWPDRIPAAAQTREISAGIDLLPTLVELCGLTFVETLEIDGISLAELLTTGGEPRRWPNRLLFTSFTPPGFHVKQAAVSVRTGRWLAVKEPRLNRAEDVAARDKWELYDMHADPYQRYDVAGEYWSLAGHMSADFAFWMKRTTENGLAPIPHEVGHEEWPEVILHRDDAVFDGDSDVEDREWQWRIETVGEDGIRCRVEIDGEIEGLSLKRDESEEQVNLDAGDGGLVLTLDRKVTAIEVQADGPSFQELRLKVIFE
jgi:arylsulfatase A